MNNREARAKAWELMLHQVCSDAVVDQFREGWQDDPKALQDSEKIIGQAIQVEGMIWRLARRTGYPV